MNGWLTSIAEALTPWKEVLGSAFAALAAVGALVSGVLKQRGRPDATFPEPAPAPTVRLNAEDRELFGDTRESVTELTRAIRHLTGATEDNTEALNRRGGGGGGRR